jgi:TatD DNase family protein
VRIVFLVDSHCHLNLIARELKTDDIRPIIERAKKEKVGYFLNVCTSLLEFPALLETALTYPQVAVSVGLHPNEQAESIDQASLMRLAQHEKVIAIGETGLDYYRSTGKLDWQQERFRMHIDVALATQKPLIIHMREAIADTLSILKESGASQIGGVMHCFSENIQVAEEAIALGFYISFSGIVTFKNAQSIQAAARHIPLERMLIETDSPYLAPNPMRGKMNEPGFVRHTAAYIADLRQIPLETLAAQTTHNFFELFKGARQPHV